MTAGVTDAMVIMLVVVNDYVDSEVPMLMRMMNRRIRGYKAIGYEIDEGHE